MKQKVTNLSGGNQQKVVIAKWFASKARIIVLDEPTRGIDIGAKVEVYKLINEMVEAGIGVILLSSEVPEVFGMADRILVLKDGQITGEYGMDEINKINETGFTKTRNVKMEGYKMKKESNGTTIVKNFMKSQGSVFIILLVMCIIASIFTDKFLSVSNLSNVLAQSVTCGIAAIGMTFVILTGGIDLSVGGCIVFSATIGTKLLSEGKCRSRNSNHHNAFVRRIGWCF